MTNSTLSTSPSWDDSSWQLLQEAMDRLIGAWRSGLEPVLAEFVPVGVDDPRYFQMVLRLIETDHECRREVEKTKEVEDYAGDFPEFLKNPEWIQAIEELMQGDRDADATVDHREPGESERKQRSGDSWQRPEAIRVLCPNPRCRQVLDVVGEEVPAKMVCPGCKKPFRLATIGVPIQNLPNDRVRPRRRIAHFELLEQLGTGAFGSVWKAWDTQLERTVAIKIPLTGQIGIDVERFFREAETAAQLEHPNIVLVHGQGQEEGVLYIVNEFVDGKNLRNWREEKQPLTHIDIAILCATLAKALHYAHQKGIVHRNIKPENILMDAAGEPHIADFGLPRITDAEASMVSWSGSHVMGTALYMPHEQARGQSHMADARSDVYSLGVVMYELLTGVRPFREQSLQILLKMVEDEPVSVRTLDPRIPQDLDTICMACLEKDPKRRYQTAGELAEDLRRFIQGKPVLRPRAGFIERTWRWCKRQPVVAGLAAALALTIVAGTLVSTYFAMETKTQARLAEEARAREFAERNRAEENLLRLRTVRYSQHIELARRALTRSQLSRAMGILSATEPDLRGWEYGYLWTCIRKRRIVFRDLQEPSCAAFDPEGRRIVAGSVAYSTMDESVKIWDLSTDRLICSLAGHPGGVYGVAFDRNGVRLASGGEDNLVRIWNPDTGYNISSLRGHTDTVRCVVFSPDGQHVVSGSDDGTVRLWDVVEGALLRTLEADTRLVNSVAISPDGKHIVSAGYHGIVKVWDTKSGALYRTFEAHTGSVNSIGFSPDGGQVVSAGDDRTIRLWNINSGELLYTLEGHTDAVESVAFSPDGQCIVSASRDMTVRMWDARAAYESRTIARHEGGCWPCVTFGPQGTRIAVTTENVEIWNISNSENEHSGMAIPESERILAYSGDGKYVLAVPGLAVDENVQLGDVHVWSLLTRTQVSRLEGAFASPSGATFSPDGQCVAICDEKGIGVWETSAGRKLATVRTDVVSGSPDPRADGMFFVGTRLFFGRGGRELAAWNPTTNRVSTVLKAQKDGVSWLGASFDGRSVISNNSSRCFDDSALYVWDIHTGRTILAFKGSEVPGTVWSIAFSRNGREVVSEGGDGTLYVWELDTGRRTAVLAGRKNSKGYSSGACVGVSFSPDGRRVVSADVDGVILWDVRTGERIFRFREIESGIGRDVAFTTDGHCILSTEPFKNRIVVWEGGLHPEFNSFDSYYEDLNKASFASALEVEPDPSELLDPLAEEWPVDIGVVLPSASPEPEE